MSSVTDSTRPVRRLRAPAAAVAVLLGGALLAAGAVPGRAQKFARAVELYTGGAALAEGIRLAGWGSGRAIQDSAYKSSGDTSIRVETNGYYSGARIEFVRPRDITDQKNDPFGFLEFTIRFVTGTVRERQRQLIAQGGAAGAAGGAFGSGGSGGSFGEGGPGSGGAGAGTPGVGSPGAGTPGGFSSGIPGEGGFGGGAEGGFGGGFGDPSLNGQTVINPDTQKLKVVLRCDEGMFVASNFPVTLFPAQADGFFQIAVPFVAFKGLDKAPTARLREIRIFGDYKDTFWIGQIRTTADDEPISVDPLDDVDTVVGEPIEFAATASGGLSPLQYSWDFDYSDGIQEDRVGQTVVWAFRKESKDQIGKPGEVQPYVVTLTVRDLSGAKKPVRRTASVIVSP